MSEWDKAVEATIECPRCHERNERGRKPMVEVLPHGTAFCNKCSLTFASVRLRG